MNFANINELFALLRKLFSSLDVSSLLDQFLSLFMLGFFISFFLHIIRLNRIKFYLQEKINILLIALLIISILQFLDINFDLFPNYQLEKSDVTITVNAENSSFSFNQLPEAFKLVCNAAAFTSGITAATTLIKNTPLPIGTKFGVVLSTGAGAVLVYNGSKKASNLLWGEKDMMNNADIVTREKSDGTFEAIKNIIDKGVNKSPLEDEEL